MDEITKALIGFKAYVANIHVSDDLDRRLGEANVLLDAVRQEIDKVWLTERNLRSRPVAVRSTGRGRAILAKLGLLREQPQETERRA